MRNGLRALIGEDIKVVVLNAEQERPRVELFGKLEFREEGNPGYYLNGTNAQIFLNYSRIEKDEKSVIMDLSLSLVQSLANYGGLR